MKLTHEQRRSRAAKARATIAAKAAARAADPARKAIFDADMAKSPPRTVTGWHTVDASTKLFLDKGWPSAVKSSAENLDDAFDAAQQWFGHPLDCGEWVQTARGEWTVSVRVAEEGK